MTAKHDIELLQTGSGGGITLQIGIRMWQHLLSLGWKVGDDITIDAKPNRIDLINNSSEQRLKQANTDHHP